MERTGLSRRKFIASAAIAGGSAALSKRLFAAHFQDPVVNTLVHDGKSVSRERISWKVRPFPMKQVRLGEGPCKQVMEADRQYLHSLPVDRLLHTFRINAGIPSRRSPLAVGKPLIASSRPLYRRTLSFRGRAHVCQYR